MWNPNFSQFLGAILIGDFLGGILIVVNFLGGILIVVNVLGGILAGTIQLVGPFVALLVNKSVFSNHHKAESELQPFQQVWHEDRLHCRNCCRRIW